MEDEESIYWMVWESSKDYETAISATKDLLRQKGDRKIFVSDNSIPRNCIISKAECNFRKINISL